MKASVDPAYLQSNAFTKIRAQQQTDKKPQLAFMDIDLTWTGNPKDQQALRKALNDQGHVLVFVTARTSEMCMTWAEREKSSPQVQKRPKAKLLQDPTLGLLCEVDPSEVASMKGLLDPDIIAATSGSEILVQQVQGGYEADTGYMSTVTYTPEDWRTRIHALIESIHKQCGKKLAIPIITEFSQNYFDGSSPVFPPDYRVQIEFATEDDMKTFLTPLEEYKEKHGIEDILVTDESHYSSSPPAFTIYFSPTVFSKRRAVDRILEMLIDSPQDADVLIAGDSYADLEMGLEGAHEASVTFLIPGGARIVPHLKTTPYQERLLQTKHGHYTYKPNGRTVVIGEEAFPGTTGPQTVLRWLQENSA